MFEQCHVESDMTDVKAGIVVRRNNPHDPGWLFIMFVVDYVNKPRSLNMFVTDNLHITFHANLDIYLCTYLKQIKMICLSLE